MLMPSGLGFHNQQLGAVGGALAATGLILMCPVTAMAGSLASGGMQGMKMYVFEEASNDSDLTVRISESNGGAKNLKMVVFDGASAAQYTSESLPEERGRNLAIPPDERVAPVVLDEYPRKQPQEDDLQIKGYGELGYRHDQMKWSKAAPGGTPNVLSELQWDAVQSVVITGGTDITFADNWQVDGKISYGQIVNGKNQDSDYYSNYRQDEFSRSNNASDDGMSIDLSAGLGYHLTVGRKNRAPYWRFTPKVGYAFHTQHFNMTDGYQTIPATGSFDGLDSTYEGTWYGPWGGMATKWAFTERFSAEAAAAYHWIDYEGTGNWNLRNDLQQPKSFTHDADGGGIVSSAVFRYLLTPNWIIRFSAEYQHWLANNDGIDKMLFADGSSAEMKFNEVKWKSYGFNLGVEYIF